MGICNIPIKTDLKSKSFNAVQACKQGDTLILEVSLFDNSATADLTGFICDLYANKNNGKGYEIINDITVNISTGKATVQCPTTLTQIAGPLRLELTFTDSANSLQKTTFDINIQVDTSVMSDSDGNVPIVIFTALEELKQAIAEISSNIEEAIAINNTLTNTNNTANNLNTLLNNTVNLANTTITNLDAAKAEAEQTIIDLQETNSAYTEHITNMDIHVTKEQKDSWNRIDSVINILDVLTEGTEVTDEFGTVITDENLVPWTL